MRSFTTELFFSISFSGVEEPVHTIVIWSLACREARNKTKCFQFKYLRRFFWKHFCHGSARKTKERTTRQTDTIPTILLGKSFDRQNSFIRSSSTLPVFSFVSFYPFCFYLFIYFNRRFGQRCWQGTIAFMACRGYATTHTQEKRGSPWKNKNKKNSLSF